MKTKWTREKIREFIRTGIGEVPLVSGGKGDQTVKSAENSQFQFSQTLQAAFAKQFGAQSATLQFLTNKLTDAVTNPQGLSPEALAATRTNATQRTAADYSHALQAVQGKMAARGGSTLPSGVDAQIQGQLAAEGANEESQSQNQITLANEQLRQQNYWNAVRGLSGTAEMENPAAFAGEANQANGLVGGLSQAYQQSKKGVLDTFTNSFAGALGSTLGGGNAGGKTGKGDWFGMGG